MTGEQPFGCYTDPPYKFPDGSDGPEYINCRYYLRATCRDNWPDDGPACRMSVHDREPEQIISSDQITPYPQRAGVTWPPKKIDVPFDVEDD